MARTGRRAIRLVSVVLVLRVLGTLACGQMSEVHASVGAGSTARRLVLVVEASGRGRPIRGFRITPSALSGRYWGGEKTTLWSAVPRRGGTAPAPDSIEYGMPPAGFTAGPAAVLVPGRYQLEVLVGGHSSISYFRIANDGTVSS